MRNHGLMRRWLAKHLVTGLALVAGSALVMASGIWIAIVTNQRSDTARCPSHSGLSADGVSLAWGEPDQCSYVDDQTGEPASPDERLAGPVDTTPYRDVAAVGLACAMLAAGGLAANRRSVVNDGSGATVIEEAG